jgi:hypothetical protein
MIRDHGFKRGRHNTAHSNGVLDKHVGGQTHGLGMSTPPMQFRLLFRCRHPFEDDLEVIDLGDTDFEMVRKTVADACFSRSRRTTKQRHLPRPCNTRHSIHRS